MISWDSDAKRQRCPSCGRDGEDGMRGTLGVTIEPDGRGVAHCFRCEHVETFSDSESHKRPGHLLPRPVSTAKHEVLSDYGRELWRECVGLAGTTGAEYLQARACVLPPPDGHLRYHPALKHPPSGTVGPALVALVTDAVTGQPLTLHRTWILANGKKAPLDPPRMLLGGHRKAGGVVRLWPDEAVTLGLGLAEGIETTLSLAHAFTPVWACIDAGNLAALQVLPGIESLLIAADHDPAGIAAAQACGVRWAAAGREARIAIPPTEKTDMNDVAVST